MMSANGADKQVIARKIERIRQGYRPRVLDLFAGCGGLSLGFLSAGYEISGAVEADHHAAATHGQNFHNGSPQHGKPLDVTTGPLEVGTRLGLTPLDTSIDVIVGGPPCQAFSKIGRAKLREVRDHPEAFLHDPRAKLYRSYLDFVSAYRPLAILMENVPEVLNHGGENIPQQLCDELGTRGYSCSYTLLNSVLFGVPQLRERMFLIAYHRDLGINSPAFPAPTHRYELPPGYANIRTNALRNAGGLFAGAGTYFPPTSSHATCPTAIVAREAISDLPEINARIELRTGRLRRGTRRLDQPHLDYDLDREVSPYARSMKEWPGFEAPSEGLYDHHIRYLPRDYSLFALMHQGDQYPELHEMAIKRFEKRARKGKITPSQDEWCQLKAAMVPPYDPGKFRNKWWKIVEDQPVRTLTAHLGKDTYSHIHHDNKQARTISIREAARLQSFPDGFRFCGTMNPAFRQIGNSVPPLLARAVALQMAATLRSEEKKEGFTPVIAEAAE